MQLIKLLPIITAVVFGVTNISAQVNYDDYLETDFKLFWHNPVRAHPGVPLDFHYSVYEKDNQTLTWELVSAPSGMTISQDGEVDWTATAADAGTHPIQVKVTREDGDSIIRDFILTVGTSDFLFVSKTGDDNNDGSINSPYGTIEHAMRQILDGDGKTVYVRDGIYQEVYNWGINGVSGPFRFTNFSAADPAVIRSYPDEHMVLDANFQGHGFSTGNADYVVLSNLEVRNAGAGERAGITLGSNSIAKDVVVRDSQWQVQNNVTGFKIRGNNSLVDRAFAYDNKDPNSVHWNSSSYLVYASSGTNTDFIYVINSQSTGSVTGFKIKHAGPRRVIFHNNISYDDFYGYGMASDFSSIRHCVSIDSKITGIFLAMTDPTTAGQNYTSEKMLIEQNTIVNPIKDGIFNTAGIYLASGSVVRNNIVYSDIISTRFLMLLPPYADFNKNLLFDISQNDVVRIGGEIWDSGTNYNFPDWQIQSPNTVWGDPLFMDLANNDVNIPENSPANYGNDEYAGAFKPFANQDLIFSDGFE